MTNRSVVIKMRAGLGFVVGDREEEVELFEEDGYINEDGTPNEEAIEEYLEDWLSNYLYSYWKVVGEVQENEE